MLHIFYSDGFP